MLGWEFPPFVAGGLGVHCFQLTRALGRQGIDVDFYMPAMAAHATPSHERLNIHAIPADPELDPYGRGYDGDFNRSVNEYNARLVASFQPRGAQLIHCHDWITVPAAIELKRRTGLPLVFTVHSTEHDRSAGLWPQTWIEDIERQGVAAADRVIAVSRYTRDLLMDRYGASPEHTVAIHNGIDASAFEASDGPGGSGTVLFLARLCRQKGPLFFLKAARKVLEVRPQTGFVVAGKGDMLDECIQYTLQHDIADRVRFTGFIPNHELLTTYRENEVYVLPSVSEPFGISALEAMAAGVPTIVSRTSGVAEAVRHVLKVDHDDVDSMAELILHVLESPSLRTELRRNGGQEARRFDWDTCARRTIETYQTCTPIEVTP